MRDNPLSRGVARLALVVAVQRPGRVLAVGAALAVLGWGLDTQTHVETDITKLVPQNMQSLRNLSALERASGVGGEIDMMVSANDLTQPKTIEWMSSYEGTVLKRFGYSSTQGCGKAELCPAFSLPALFQGAGGAGAAPLKLKQNEVRALLAADPALLLPRRPSRPGSPRGDAGLRHPPDATIEPPAAGDREGMRAAAASARRCQRAARGACRCWPPRPMLQVSSVRAAACSRCWQVCLAVGLVLLAASPRRLAPRGGSRCCRSRLPRGWSALIVFRWRRCRSTRCQSRWARS